MAPYLALGPDAGALRLVAPRARRAGRRELDRETVRELVRDFELERELVRARGEYGMVLLDPEERDLDATRGEYGMVLFELEERDFDFPRWVSNDRDLPRIVERELDLEALLRRKTYSPLRFLTSLVSLERAAGRNELERDRARAAGIVFLDELDRDRDFLDREDVRAEPDELVLKS